MKKIVRLTESELKNIVEASVRRAIQEGVLMKVMLKAQGGKAVRISNTSWCCWCCVIAGIMVEPVSKGTLKDRIMLTRRT